jgi:hypothetical protein
MGDMSTTLRALAHPGSVLALVVLVLNDHVLKQAWPGWVTGKLSDVAGLVVAPLLLAAVLALVRVPRAMPVSLAATGAGFVLCKTSTFGAEVTSTVWSLFGTPTMIRADVTDLLALPALYAAWRIHRTVAAAVGGDWRRTVAVAVGTALLPVGVLATSATSCGEWRGYTGVAVLEGDFPGTPHEEEVRLGGDDDNGWLTIDADGRFAEPGVQVDGPGLWQGQRTRTCVAGRCWRLEGDSVESSVDGRSWSREGTLTEADRATIVEQEGDEECGDPLPVRPVDIAAAELGGGVQVIVALERGGIWRRNIDGTWTVLTIDTLGEAVQRDLPSPPRVTEVDAPDPPEETGATVPESGSPTPACASPSTYTVTPNPLNGPPTTHEVCP